MIAKFLIIVLLLALTNSKNPGFVTTLTQNGANYAGEVIVQFIEQERQRIEIPNQGGDVSTPIGTVEWSLENLNITRLELQKPKIDFEENKPVTVTVTGINLNLSFQWRYRQKSWPNLRDSGTGEVIATQTSFNGRIRLHESEGRPQLSFLEATLTFGKFDIKLSGGASWLYQIFLSIFQSTIKKALEDIIKGFDKKINEVLQKLPTTVRIPNTNVGLDYSIKSNPVQGNGYVSLFHVGEIFNWERRKPFQFPTQNLPQIIQREKMAEVFVTQYFLNTGLQTLYENDMLKFELTDADIPRNFPFRLNTNSLKDAVPQLYQRFPNKLIVLQGHVTVLPTVEITPQSLKINGVVSVTWYVDQSSKGSVRDLVKAFTTSHVAKIDGFIECKDGKLGGKVVLSDLKNSIVDSNIGVIDIGRFGNFLNQLFRDVIIPIVNQELENGIPLPSIPFIEYQDPVILYRSGFVSVGLSVKFVPPTTRSLESPSLVQILNTVLNE